VGWRSADVEVLFRKQGPLVRNDSGYNKVSERGKGNQQLCNGAYGKGSYQDMALAISPQQKVDGL
jgi:hypothetical protein